MTQQAKNLIAQARTEGWKRLNLGNCNLTDLQTQVPELFELKQLEELVLSNERQEWNDTIQMWVQKKNSNKGQANFLSQLPQAMAQLKQLKVLVCGGDWNNAWAISDLSFLQTLPQLTQLILNHNKITKLENLDKLPNLQQLNISQNLITKLENLDKLPNLQQLDISHNQITKLENLDKLPNLQLLWISSNKITQLENLDKLPNLQKLVIGYNQITQLENLDKLPNLQQLVISNNQIVKLENLDKLPNLQKLVIGYNQIVKLENLDKLPNLQQLVISNNQIVKLENLDKLPKLQQLDISENKITKLENLDKLPNLQQLVISNNQIVKLENLDKLPNLQQLVISENKITKLENLDKLPNLQQLVIYNNQITQLENLDKLPNLQQLVISYNQITQLENLDKLPNLQQLDISHNQITKLENLDKLPNLQKLVISNNQIAKLENLDKLPNLQQLEISNNQITQLENTIDLPNLQQLVIWGNRITKLENLDKLPNLQRLHISDNQITQLENLDKLPNLQQLHLHKNKITQLENLDKLPNLQQLDISDNQITQLENLDKLPNLQQLDISWNKITKLENLDKLPNLQQLDISWNEITKLENLDKLPNLQQLDIGYNQITDLSPLLPFLQRKEEPLQLVLKFDADKGEINVESNPITTPPIEIVEQGTAAVLSYFKDLAKGAANNKEIKLIVVGNGCVGKTALVRRLLHRTYEHIDVATGHTHGIIIDHYHLPDSDIQLHIWDFGGQEIYHATHRLFLSSNALYLLLWSNEPQDQPNEPHYPPSYWLDYIAELSNNNRVLLVPSKQDKYGNYALPNFTELQAKYKGKGLQLFQLNAISALNGINIRTLEAQLTELANELLLQHSQKLPNNWVAARQRVYEQWIGKRKIATLADFTDLCHNLDLDNEITVLRYLNDSGVLFWQADTLQNDIIVDQQYFLDIIYEVFKNRHVKKDGVFTWVDACDIWQCHKNGHVYSDDDRRLFLHFMSSCEIMFETQNEQDETEYVIPQLLPNTPLIAWLNKPNEKQLRLTYPFLHRNIIERFIIRTAQFAKQAKSWWRNGIYLADEQGNEAYIQATNEQQDNRNQSIVVKVCGNNDLQLLAKIRNEFAQLSRFEQVKQEVSLDVGKTWVDVSHIKRQQERGEGYIYTPTNAKEVISPYLAFLDTETTLSSSSPIKTMNHKEHLQQLVAQGKLKQAIAELLKATQQNRQSDLYNSIIHLSGRFHGNEEDKHNDEVSVDNYKLELNKIRKALLSFLNEYQPSGNFVFTPQGTTNNPNTTQGSGNVIKDSIIINIHSGQVNIAERINKIKYHAGNGISKEDFEEFKQSLKQLTPVQQQAVTQRLTVIETSPEENRSSLIGEFKTFLLDTGIAINQNLASTFIWEIIKPMFGG